MERLQKVIASSGYCSRRKAEDLIVSGKVYVNGKKVDTLGYKVSGNDIIKIGNEILKKEDFEYYLLYKPRGVITSVSDDKKRKTVVDLIDTDKRIYPVGRLDYDTTGALILTNDGVFANTLMHPKNKVEKEYVAKVKGILTPVDIDRLKKGVIIDGVKTSRSKVKMVKVDKKKNTCLVRLTIHEGKNHQVKKMFNSIGYDVLKLKRERIDFLDLRGLKSGEYRKLSIKEVKKIYSKHLNKS